MKYKITKLYSGNVEFIYGENMIMLTEFKPSIVLTRSEYHSILKHKQYLIDNQFVAVEFVEEEVKESKDVKKFNK